MSRVLVLGSGHLGGAVVRALGDHDVVHTWHRNERDLPGRGVRADLARPGGLDALFDTLGDWMPDHAIHCAGIPPSDAEDDAPWHIWPGTAAALGRRMSRGQIGRAHV